MALTATAQSALPPVPSWDETIVPTLRKRLEHESRALAKRISAASIVSIQDNSPEFASHSHNHYYPHRGDAPGTSFSPRPSGIPRPSLQSSRPSISGDRPTTPTRTSSPFKRTRTLSQPKLMEPMEPSINIPAVPRPDPRAVSPHTPRPSDVRPTRIPIPRTRTPSTSGHAQPSMVRSESRNGASGSYHNLSTDGPPGAVAEQPHRHRSRTRGPSIDSTVPRPSLDSEERQFEHWYRGEVSRNGGVGELRVGRRMEMLEIANYGHMQTRPVDHWRNGGAGKQHRRAGSTDAHFRGSIYLEADGEHARVLDESPPTDIEDGMDFESDLGHRSTVSTTRAGSPAASTTTRQYPGLGVADNLTPVAGVGSSSAGPRSRSGSRTAQPSRIPTPSMSRQLSDPPRTPTPTQMGTSIPAEPDSPRAPSRKVRQDNATPPSPPRVPTVTPQTPKKRAKSPAAIAQSPSAKKSRSRAPPVSQARPNRDDSKRRSVGEYPVPADEDMADAIPTWTQPVSPGGNWDDVVVPVVARKKGMGEFYTRADGRQQKRPRSLIPEPVSHDPALGRWILIALWSNAPGTFGYDYSKARSRLDEDDDIPMADLVVDDNSEVKPPEERRMPPIKPRINGRDPTKEGRPGETVEEHVRTRTQPSPAPFSRYQRSMGHENHEGRSGLSSELTTADIKPSVSPGQGRTAQGEEELEAGCCKCVIM
ncbi:hypothetical protein EDB85DRAFT_1865921 [Lactarius pseudohatsudake]|nr:hypothetical protein EDB85DRAFT_1865921 [Lactarius pseudohatsudake]